GTVTSLAWVKYSGEQYYRCPRWKIVARPARGGCRAGASGAKITATSPDPGAPHVRRAPAPRPADADLPAVPLLLPAAHRGRRPGGGRPGAGALGHRQRAGA